MRRRASAALITSRTRLLYDSEHLSNVQLPPDISSELLETVVSMVVNSALTNPQIVRVLADTEDEILSKERVATLLNVSESKLDQMISDGQWYMVKSPTTGKWGMTRKQFRAQRDMLYHLKIR